MNCQPPASLPSLLVSSPYHWSRGDRRYRTTSKVQKVLVWVLPRRCCGPTRLQLSPQNMHSVSVFSHLPPPPPPAHLPSSITSSLAQLRLCASFPLQYAPYCLDYFYFLTNTRTRTSSPPSVNRVHGPHSSEDQRRKLRVFVLSPPPSRW